MRFISTPAFMRILALILSILSSAALYYFGYEMGMRRGYNIGTIRGYVQCWDVHQKIFGDGKEVGSYLSKEKEGIEIQKRRFDFNYYDGKYADLSVISFDPMVK